MRLPGSLRRIFVPSVSLVGGTIDLADLPAMWCGSEPDVTRYEKALASYLRADDVITYNSGRSALYEILRALGIGSGDEVIVPGFTCIAVPAAIVSIGATPVYADLLPGSCNVDPDSVAALVSSRTRAILAQHTFGIPCDLDALLTIARRCGAPVIEDCAHALGAQYRGKYCGTVGDVGFFSSEHTKMLSTGKGGGIIVANGKLRDRLRAQHAALEEETADVVDLILRECVLDTIRGAPRLGGLGSTAIKLMSGASRKAYAYVKAVHDYNEVYFGAQTAGELWTPRRLSGRQAALGRIQIERLEADVNARVVVVRKLQSIAPTLGWTTFDIDWAHTRPSFVRYPFVVGDREAWVGRLRKAGIDVGFWFTDPVHPNSSSHGKVSYRQGSCPRAEGLCNTILNLPVNRKVSSWICDRIESLAASVDEL